MSVRNSVLDKLSGKHFDNTGEHCLHNAGEHRLYLPESRHAIWRKIQVHRSERKLILRTSQRFSVISAVKQRGREKKGPPDIAPKSFSPNFKGPKWCSVLSIGVIGKSALEIGHFLRRNFWMIFRGPFLSWPLCFTADNTVPSGIGILISKVPEGQHPRGATLREALRGNLPLRGLCGGFSEGSAGVSPRALWGSAGVRGIFRGFSGVVTLCL